MPPVSIRAISILGATGSIGQSSYDLILRNRADYRTVALTGGRNVAQLARMARELGAEIAVTAYDDCLNDLREALLGSGIAVAAGEAAIVEAAMRPTDLVLSAIVGNAGLAPGFAALAHTKTLALANKESLVTAGPLLLAEAQRHGTKILPVDSEHSAIFQALRHEDMARVEQVTITASGGALRDWPMEALASATIEQASCHPNWTMGQRITIDSASMFNKAMEVIEAREFFGLDPDQIKVLQHPQSIVHAMVSFVDGAVMAHLGAPDMRHAIGYALNYPDRSHLPVARLDLAQIGGLTFATPDLQRFPALRICREVMAVRGAAGGVFTAAKEVALDLFLAGKIGFMQMSSVVEVTLSRLSGEIVMQNSPTTLEAALQIDHLTRKRAQEAAQSFIQGR
jgi:1-deoxy-D-xylulose-5-phosphate reductoisomerase